MTLIMARSPRESPRESSELVDNECGGGGRELLPSESNNSSSEYFESPNDSEGGIVSLSLAGAGHGIASGGLSTVEGGGGVKKARTEQVMKATPKTALFIKENWHPFVSSLYEASSFFVQIIKESFWVLRTTHF